MFYTNSHHDCTALLNVAIMIPGCGLVGALLLRGGTGCAMALVYPMACKVAASWFVENRGVAIGSVRNVRILWTILFLVLTDF